MKTFKETDRRAAGDDVVRHGAQPVEEVAVLSVGERVVEEGRVREHHVDISVGETADAAAQT
jgi:hypothetical protein